MADRIYTKLGDDGSTGLLFGGRVAKTDPVVEAVGTIDEVVSVLGVARALLGDAQLGDLILVVQRHLFVVSADLMANPRGRDRLEAGVSLVVPEMVSWVETKIDDLVPRRPLSTTFLVPGSTMVSAILDTGRSVARRAERRVVELTQDGRVPNPVLPVYMNRLSDLLYVVARAAADPADEVPSHQ